MRSRLAWALALALTLGACAARTPAMPPMPVAPRHPDFLYPAAPALAETDRQALRIERGWRHLQAGNLRNAEREFAAALKQEPTFFPAETALGYLELAQADAGDALARFDRAVQRAAEYPPALVGRGQALLALGRDGEALASFEAALAVNADLADVRSRVDVLRFRALQGNLARAREASEAGRLDEARAAYTQALAASPDSPFLYRELALVERQAGDTAQALEHFRRAVALDASDARSHAQIGAILAERGEYAAAIDAYERARALDANEVAATELARVRELAARATLPAEFRAIATAPAVARADVAALLAVELERLLAATGTRQAVITDIRGHWAQAWITAVVRAGLMDTLPNYAFQPGARVRRVDLAQTVARVLNLLAARKPELAKAWQGVRLRITDVPPGHLSYPAVSMAVASGVMPLDGGNFGLLRPVTGAEATEVVNRLQRLAAQ